jgi:hypothetical protein
MGAGGGGGVEPEEVGRVHTLKNLNAFLLTVSEEL